MHFSTLASNPGYSFLSSVYDNGQIMSWSVTKSQKTCLTSSALSVSFKVLYVVLSICVAVLCVLKLGQEEVCMSILGNVKGDSVIVFGKVGLWMLVLIFTGCVQHHHNRVRSRGYLRFYRQTQGLKHVPLTIHSAGRAAHILG